MCLFPWHRRQGSQVPHKSPDESHASCTPDTARPVSRLPPRSSRSSREAPVSMSSNPLSMLQRRFACARLSHPHMTQSLPRLLTMTLTTAAFDRSSSWQFEASPYKATSKGPPSSLVQHGEYTPSWHNFSSGRTRQLALYGTSGQKRPHHNQSHPRRLQRRTHSAGRLRCRRRPVALNYLPAW